MITSWSSSLIIHHHQYLVQCSSFQFINNIRSDFAFVWFNYVNFYSSATKSLKHWERCSLLEVCKIIPADGADCSCLKSDQSKILPTLEVSKIGVCNLKIVNPNLYQKTIENCLTFLAKKIRREYFRSWKGCSPTPRIQLFFIANNIFKKDVATEYFFMEILHIYQAYQTQLRPPPPQWANPEL